MRFFVPLLAALCVVGCQQAPVAAAPKSADPAKDVPNKSVREPQVAEASGGGLVAASDGSFTMELPSSWAPLTGDSAEAKALGTKLATTNPDLALEMKKASGMEAVLLIALDNATLDDKSPYSDNLTVNVQPSQHTEWKDSTVTQITEVFKEAFGDPNVQTTLVTIAGKKVLRYKARMKVAAGAYEMLGYQFLHNNQVYTAVLSCGDGKLIEREKTFDAIATSLKFKA